MRYFARARSVGVLLVLLLCSFGNSARAYSLLTHEQLIDLTWKDSIVPLLLSRYPTLTPEQLELARAYAYGGCVIQDIGYYPFGDKNFSNLTHYVRTGDFIVNLFRNAGNADELAFAIGALSHYIGDTVGHSLATNLAVPQEFPKLKARYGKVVNYAEGEHQHVQTEFAFDINEIAHHRVAPSHYLKHIGLEVPIKQLALAFYQTYGLAEDFSGTRGRRVNVRGYRFAVRSFIPRIAYALTLLHRKDEPADPMTPEVAELIKETTIVAAENNWDLYRRHAGIGTYTLAGFLYIVPKFGPLKLAAVKGPTPDTEALYLHSVAMSIGALRRVLHRFTPPPTTVPTAAIAAAADPAAEPAPANPAAKQDVPRQSSDPRHPLKNRDLDTGFVVRPGGYRLTDDTYADLVHRLALKPEGPIPPAIKEDILAYYANPDSPITTKQDQERWAQVQADLVTLQTIPTSTEPEPYATYGDDAEGDTSSAPTPPPNPNP
ncbi:MAG: zinc dependent phospholipase C family protein [Acidobacteriaceae bacterium]